MSKDTMEQTKQILNDAFIMFSSIPVSGEYVEVMAAAKEKLRRINKIVADEIQELTRIEKEKADSIKKG